MLHLITLPESGSLHQVPEVTTTDRGPLDLLMDLGL